VPRLLASGHPIAGKDDCQAYLARLSAFAGALDQATSAFLGDVALGVIAPAAALAATRDQLKALRQAEPAANPLAASLASRAAAKGIPGAWATAAANILARQVYPALDRQLAAIDGAMPVAGAQGLIPQQRAFYADALGFHTASTLSPDEVHRIGLDQLAEIGAELDPLLRRLGLTSGSVGERLAALPTRPGESFTDCDEGRSAVISEFAAALERVQPHLSAEFPVVPSAPRAVRCLAGGFDPIERSEAEVRQGTLYLAGAAQWHRYAIPSGAFRAGLPGASWEAAAASASPSLPPIRRHAARHDACSEGWALYAERVAADGGLYADDPACHVGYLQARLVRAAMLVADTGLHARGWSRERAEAVLVSSAGLRPEAAAARVDRAMLLPGEACAAAVGEAEWLRLRALAERIAESGFDSSRFHGLIAQGSASFAVLEEVVTDTFNKRRSVLGMRTVLDRYAHNGVSRAGLGRAMQVE